MITSTSIQIKHSKARPSPALNIRTFHSFNHTSKRRAPRLQNHKPSSKEKLPIKGLRIHHPPSLPCLLLSLFHYYLSWKSQAAMMHNQRTRSEKSFPFLCLSCSQYSCFSSRVSYFPPKGTIHYCTCFTDKCKRVPCQIYNPCTSSQEN